MTPESPEIFPGKPARGRPAAMPALASGGLGLLAAGALGQMRVPSRARRLKGEDTDQEPVYGSFHNDNALTQ